MTNKPNNDIEDLRAHLFDTLRSLKGEVKPVEIQRAKAVCDVAGQIIETAKVEVSFMKATRNKTASCFFDQPAQPALPEASPADRPNGKAV